MKTPSAANAKNQLAKLMPLAAFCVPLLALYVLNPAEPYGVSAQSSFELMWKGRTFMLFFVWLIGLELILGWEKIIVQIKSRIRTAAYAAALTLPSIYVAAEYLGLNNTLTAASQAAGATWATSMPLAIEYIVFAAFFLLIAALGFGKRGLTSFVLPALFAFIVGALYTIDNVYPYGEFTPFQLLVPTTASLAASLLGWMGYSVVPGTDFPTGMPTLDVSNALGSAKFAIAWPCAGIESLLIFAAVALLFLKQVKLSWKLKLGFFFLGAIVTYAINVVRIAMLFVLGVQYGVDSAAVSDFHFYYGPLYAMAWIVTYPLVIMAASWAINRTKRIPPQPPSPA